MVKVKLNNYITVVKADMFNEKPGLVVYAISVTSLCYRLEGSFFPVAQITLCIIFLLCVKYIGGNLYQSSAFYFRQEPR